QDRFEVFGTEAGTVVVGGEGGIDNDTLVVSNVIGLTYGGGNNESGVITFEGGGTLAFSEIEHLVLNGGNPDGIIYGTAGDDSIGAGYVDANGDVIDNNDAILGTPGSNDDEVYAGAGNDTVNGLLGNDFLYGGDGNDSLSGGVGNDYMQGDAGNDTVLGGDGNDLLRGDTGNDLVDGGAGDDTVYGGADSDTVYGGDGNDQVYGGFGDDTVYGGAGNDTITGSGENDLVFGDDGDDLMQGSDGADTLIGGAGADTMLGEEDADSFYGGVGDYVDGYETVTTGSDNDTLHVSGVDHIVWDVLNPENGVVHFTGGGTLQFYNIEHVIVDGTEVPPPNYIVEGTAGDDLIDANYTGDPQGDRVDASDSATANNDDLIYAGAGNDTVLAGDGNDTVHGGDGNDFVSGGAGNDYLIGGAGNDSLSGGEGNDSLWGDAGADTLLGGLGDDALLGGDGDDTLFGEGGNDTLWGELGNDQLVGGLGDDWLEGEAGDDTLRGDDGNDSLFGGIGNDSLLGGLDNDSLDGGDGDDFLSGETGNDSLTAGAGADVVSGGAGDDLLDAGAGDDLLDAGTGNDVVSGGDGNDWLYSGDGNDTAYGGAGEDVLIGEAGDDLQFGGAGNDIFYDGDGNDTLLGEDDRDSFFAGVGDVVDGGEGGDDYDTLDLTAWGHPGTNIIYDTMNPENGIVEFLDASGVVIGSMTFSNIENVVACFTPGAMILTDQGEVAVEDLAEGDLVLTRDSGFQPIRWVGRRDLTAAELAVQPRFNPVRIAQGALGGDLPERDMLVSPQHRMLMTGARAELLFGEHEVLVAATHMVGMSGVGRVMPETVSYIHILFDRHEVVRADGAWSESFQPGAQTLNGLDAAQRAEILALFPTLALGGNYPAARLTLKAKEAQVLLRA
ncbi:MAG: Hint domain-containing protein, partial [Cypionkella sp.]|uniref:Hint domain-containing protein n=1 Tax=Cypionkella sp. TaxID=2811411 RepID=UPI00271E1B43